MKTILTGAVLCVWGIALATWLYVGLDWSGATAQRQTMLHELFKFSLTTVVVGGAALFYGALQRRNEERHEQATQAREAKAAKRNRLEVFLREFTDAYNEIKFVRRELRRSLVPNDDGTFCIDEEIYTELLGELNHGQLKLEQFRRVIESKPAYLSFFGDEGIIWLSSAEDYLRRVTSEYEYRCLAHVEDEPSKLVVPQKSSLFQYVISRKDTRHDGSSVTEHFGPLDCFFRELTSNIEGQD